MPLETASPTVPPSPAALARARTRCAAIVRSRAKNFAWAFVFMPREKRQALEAVYAFCRIADDHADDDALPVPERRGRLLALHARLNRALPASGDAPPPDPGPDEVEDEALLAVADAARRFGVRRDDLDLVVAGCLQDLDVTRYRTWDDLRAYCHMVAGAVGLACLEIFEHTPGDEARPIAVDLGLAMQVANIVRDVDEDLARGRVYLPAEDLARFGVDEATLFARRLDDRVRALLAFEVARARELFASGARLAAFLPRRSRVCPEALASLYLGVLDEIERRGYDVFSSRARLSTPRKVLVAGGALARAMLG